MLKHIDAMLQDWTEFQVRMLGNSGIGYPNKSPIATLIDYRTRPESRSAGAIVPFFRNTPGTVQRIDQVLRVLPDAWLEAVNEFYIQPRPRRRYATARLDRLHHVVQGALLMLDG